MDGKAPVFEKMGQQYCQKSVIAAVARVEHRTLLEDTEVNIIRTSRNARLVPTTEIRHWTKIAKPPLRWPVPVQLCLFVQATARAFRFLRQPSRPIAPRPVAKRGRAAGTGVATSSCVTFTSLRNVLLGKL